MSDPIDVALAGDSLEQREAETATRNLLSEQLGVALAPRTFDLPNKTQVQIDAVSADAQILAEIWAHQGPLKGGQPNKVMVDALKLMYVEAMQGHALRKICCFTDEAALKPFLGAGWRGKALNHYGIELVVIELPAEIRAKIVAAQKRQYR